MALIREDAPLWWDREVDDRGRPIRADVREAARQIWPSCCARVEATLHDVGEAPGLMEAAVAYISRYLTRHKALAFYPQARSLLSLHFSQDLKRRAGRESRIQAVGLAADLDLLTRPSSSWVEEIEFWQDMAKLHRRVDDRSWISLVMRYMGHDWPEVSEKLGIAVSTAQNHFRENFKRAWLELNGNRDRKKAAGNGRRR